MAQSPPSLPRAPHLGELSAKLTEGFDPSHWQAKQTLGAATRSVASRRDDGEGELLYQNTLPTAYRLLTRSSRYSGSAGSRLLMTTPPLADAPVEWI